MTLLIVAGLIVAAGVFAALLFIRAPYERYYRRGWGPAGFSKTCAYLAKPAIKSPTLVLPLDFVPQLSRRDCRTIWLGAGNLVAAWPSHFGHSQTWRRAPLPTMTGIIKILKITSRSARRLFPGYCKGEFSPFAVNGMPPYGQGTI